MGKSLKYKHAVQKKAVDEKEEPVAPAPPPAASSDRKTQRGKEERPASGKRLRVEKETPAIPIPDVEVPVASSTSSSGGRGNNKKGAKQQQQQQKPASGQQESKDVLSILKAAKKDVPVAGAKHKKLMTKSTASGKKDSKDLISEVVFGKKAKKTTKAVDADGWAIAGEDGDDEDNEEDDEADLLDTTPYAAEDRMSSKLSLGGVHHKPAFGPGGVSPSTLKPHRTPLSTTIRPVPKATTTTPSLSAQQQQGVEEQASAADGAAKAFIKDYIKQRKEDPNAVGVKSGAELMAEANEYFENHTAEQRKRNHRAINKLREMKKANRAGGDKDGFKYVIPKNHKELLRLEEEREGMVSGKELRSTFGGDGVDDTTSKPVRKNKRKGKFHDDFYQFQTVQKWTKNAENFLSKTKRGREAMHQRRTANRSIKKM